ncbi:MAG: hypothetical protein IIC67_06420 [Thaumarchaeota archaeon]|nr:hypothetical protein [Nitrososphaerota archaeon]
MKTKPIFLSEQFKTKLTSDDSVSQSNREFKKKVGEPHPFDYKVVEGVAQKFGLVSAIIDKISDYTIGPQLKIDSEDEKVVEVLEKWMKQTRFKAFLRPWFKQGLLKGFSPLEVAGLSDFNLDDMVKVVPADTVFAKRDEFGEITEYNQFIGNDLNKITDDDVISLNKDEIIHLDINNIGNSAYGMGIVFSALSIINDFLSAQKAMHKIMMRKANNPIHVKMGDIEHDIIPEQSDIDAFGQKLQFMNECTEWVTDDTIDMTVLDFGNIGEKFQDILANDYKLLSYSFQVPEIVLGSVEGGGLGSAGKSNVQMDAFERNIQSYQEQLAFIIESKIFDIVLVNNGIINAEYKITWGQQSQGDKNELLIVYQQLLAVQTLSAGMRMEIERKIAVLDDIDFDEVEKENKKDMRRQNREQDKMFKQQKQLKAASVKPTQQEDMIPEIIEGLDSGMAPQEIELELIKKYEDIDEDIIKQLIDETIRLVVYDK